MRLHPVVPLTLRLALPGVIALGALPGPDPAGAGVAPAGHAVWPLDPRPAVVRGFDPPESPWGSGHRGVDLLGKAGQPVRAVTAGRITFAGRLAGRGVVVVDHGALRTTYEPVAAVVPVDAVVTTGQQIGTLQLPMSHCFPRACLHWGLLRGDTYLDPLSLLGLGPLRLLPLRGGVAGRWSFGMPARAPTADPVSSLRPWGARGGMPAAVVPR